MFCLETLSPSLHVDACLTGTAHPNTVADQVRPLMAKTLLNGSGRPAGQCSCITAKSAQEQPKEHDKELKVSNQPLNSPDLKPTERPSDVP